MEAGSIPTIDLEDFASDDPTRKARALDAIRVGFGEYGLVYVRSHGVPDTTALYDEFTAVTDRPRAEKERWNHPEIWYQRGWTPPNTERAVIAGGQPDFKECWFAAPEPIDPELVVEYPEIAAANVWPAERPRFESEYMTTGRALHRAGVTLMRAAALALGLDESTFTSRVEGGPHVFRMLRYLPLEASQTGRQDILWGEEHTDFNLVTLLPGGRFHDPDGRVSAAPDDRSGLYLRTRATAEHPEGRMVRGTAPKGAIVAQVGQQLEILTGGRFLATPHVITAPATPGYSRLSAAHFVHCHSHTMLFPLPELRTPESIEAYRPPVLAGTYSLKTLVDIGLAPPSTLDQLGYRHYGRLASMRTRSAE